jgi:hypothetical protein
MGLVFISNALGFDPKTGAMLCGIFLWLLIIYSILSYLFKAPMKWPLVCGLAGAIFGYALGVQVWNVLVVFEFMPQTVSVLLLAVPYAALMAWASHRGGQVAHWCWGMAAIGGFLGLVTVPLLAPRAAVHGMFNDVLYVTGPIAAAVGAVVGTAIGVVRERIAGRSAA